MVIDQRTSREQEPLSCLELRHSFGDRKVLKGISLDLAPGAVFGLIGSNGAGKSTLIRILLGLVRPDGGEAKVLGCDSRELSDPVKQRLAYVPQQPDAFQWMKVGEMLEFISGYYPVWDAGYVEKMLTRFEIPRKAKLSKLSPGERQSIALIRALATQPALLVLDEPAAALDPSARRELLREIAGRAGESGTTVFFSTHIVSDLERVASHVAFLHGGRLVINALMDDLKETHARFTLASEAELPPHIAGELSRRRHRDGSVSLVIQCRAGEEWPAHGALGDAMRESLSLEDLFVEVVQ